MVSLSAMIKLAQKSPYRNWRHAAIVFRGGAVVSMATNTHNLHAEIRALNKVKYKHNLSLLSIRVNKNGELRLAYPCTNCMSYLQEHNVQILLYSTENGEIKRERVE